jgi:hypothetical protein
MGWVRPRGTVARVSSTHTPHEMPTTIGDGDEGHGPAEPACRWLAVASALSLSLSLSVPPMKGTSGQSFLFLRQIFPPPWGKSPLHSPPASRRFTTPLSDSLRVDTPHDREVILPHVSSLESSSSAFHDASCTHHPPANGEHLPFRFPPLARSQIGCPTSPSRSYSWRTSAVRRPCYLVPFPVDGFGFGPPKSRRAPCHARWSCPSTVTTRWVCTGRTLAGPLGIVGCQRLRGWAS